MLKKIRWTFFVFGILILLGGALLIVIAAGSFGEWIYTGNKAADNDVTDSQPCRFKEFEGVLTVEEIRSNSSVNNEKDALIIYRFEPENENAPPHVKKERGQIETTRAEIGRLGIKPGSRFETKARYIIQGFCRPGPYIDDLDKWKAY